MFKWFYWWKLSRKAKKHLKMEIKRAKSMGLAQPPTLEEVEKFKKDYDMGWNSHMVDSVPIRRTYFEAELRK